MSAAKHVAYNASGVGIDVRIDAGASVWGGIAGIAGSGRRGVRGDA